MNKPVFSGIAVIAAGIAVVVGFFLFTRDFTPEMGLAWNFTNMEVVLEDKVVGTYLPLSAFRSRYKMYSDLSDEELTRRMHGRFFSSMTLEEYQDIFLHNTGPAPEKQVSFSAGFTDPFNIRGDFDEVRTTDPITRAVMTQDAIDYGFIEYRRVKNAFPYRYALIAGLALIGAGTLIVVLPGRKKA